MCCELTLTVNGGHQTDVAEQAARRAECVPASNTAGAAFEHELVEQIEVLSVLRRHDAARARHLRIDHRVAWVARSFVPLVTTQVLDEAGQNAGLGLLPHEGRVIKSRLASGAGVTS